METMMMQRNPKLPKRAGKAKIEFIPLDSLNQGMLPQREERHILLPLHPRAEFQPLRGGEQFLFTMPASSVQTAVYFGGTDEEPFLVRLQPEILPFFRQGEAALYDALVPPVIRRVQRVLKVEHKRQGDIFAVPVEWNWRDLLVLKALQTKEDAPRPEPVWEKRESVFETRHLFTGRTLDVHVGWIPDATFWEGGLEAPDHENLVFQGTHLLAQTAFLFDPKNAD